MLGLSLKPVNAIVMTDECFAKRRNVNLKIAAKMMPLFFCLKHLGR